jgi:hypothetical protein
MKIRVTLTIEVDPEAWTLAYGTEPEDLREDVKTYVLGTVAECAAAREGGIQNVLVR